MIRPGKNNKSGTIYVMAKKFLQWKMEESDAIFIFHRRIKKTTEAMTGARGLF